MLTKYKDGKPKKSLNINPLKNVFITAAYSEIFFREGAPNFDIVSRVFFSGRIIFKHIENKKGFRGVRGHAHPESF